jgi:hypothetical protein
MGIHERNSLAPDDLAPVASLDSAHGAAAATPFPEEDLGPYPQGLSDDRVLAHSKAWCQARSSGARDARGARAGSLRMCAWLGSVVTRKQARPRGASTGILS